VLIVDDDESMIRILSRLLGSDYTLLSARGGAQALELLAQESVDLVLMDVQMPGMDGFELLTRVRTAPETADLPVILISALSDNRDIARGLQLGANDYVTKPIDATIVQARVRTQVALKRAIDDHKETIRSLQQAQLAQRDFQRILSHDLKGPLTNMRLGHFILRDFVGNHPDALTILDNMEATTDAMLNIIRTFLDAAEYEQGTMPIQIERQHVGEAVLRAVEQYNAAALRKRIRLCPETAEDWIMGDSVLVAQILSNLIGNAVKFSPFDTEVRIWTQKAGASLRICVADQGPGVPPEERDKLFQRFGRLTPRPTGSESSTGLGLWIVKRLAELQGGCVGADFPADGGSIFWVELPMADGA
jgi:two-component system sensor histidine kinase/response regulator